MDVAQSNSSEPKFTWLGTVDGAFASMLEAIHHAESSVRLEMYIYGGTSIGEKFRTALTEAAARGVEVKVLIDALGSFTLSDRFWDPVRAAGGEVRWFNPIKVARLGIRNHRKVLVCDEKVAFVGGFNISQEYEGDGVTRGWLDLGIRLRGPLVAPLIDAFEQSYAAADFEHGRLMRLRKSRMRRMVSTPDGQLLLSGPGRGYHFIKHSLERDFLKARSIQIMCAYFLPNRSMRLALSKAARKGCKVQLLLAGKSDIPLSRMASRGFFQAFFNAGIEIYEYQPQVLHAKLFLVDDILYLGSSNLDRRSLYINYELLLRLPDNMLIPQARAAFAEALGRSKNIDPSTWRASRTFWTKIKERLAHFIFARVDPFLARRQFRMLVQAGRQRR